jgi:molecular chaperone GrpE (heat shock protein)
MWNQEKEARTKYHGLINGVLLWLDHFEQAAKENKTGKADEWLFRKARRILEDEGIEEIAVKRGEMFDGRRHKQGGSRPDGLPKDAILELLRKGYYIKGRGNQEDVVFRPAEVVCSSGPRS